MPLSRTEQVERRRAELPATDLRPIQPYVLDTSAPGFAEACRRQSLLITAAYATIERTRDNDFWEHVSADAWDGLG